VHDGAGSWCVEEPGPSRGSSSPSNTPGHQADARMPSSTCINAAQSGVSAAERGTTLPVLSERADPLTMHEVVRVRDALVTRHLKS
jgi:hypothetical protein